MTVIISLHGAGWSAPTEPVLQHSSEGANDGGAAAALAMALACRGVIVPQKVLEKELWYPNGNTTARRMIEAARKRGLTARGVSVPEPGLFAKVPVGSILHRRDLRFQVLRRYDRGTVWLLDGGDGEHRISLAEFWKDFDGIALLFE